MKKILISLLILSLFALSLAGCSGSAAPAPEPGDEPASGETPAAPSEEPLKIGLVLPGSINDGGWSSAAYQGLMAIEEMYGAEVSYMEAKSPSDVVDGFRDYGARGFDIVFGHSYDYQDAAKRVAPDFPDTVYITSGGTTIMDNVSPIYFEFEQATYLAGVVAATMTKTGKVAAIGSQEMPAITKSLVSFEQGVKDTDPSIQVISNYLGTQDDLGKAKETTSAMIADGVDIFWVSANAAGKGALQAVEEAKDKGVLIFGSYGKWSEESPDVVIADLYLDNAEAFVAATERITAGFEPGEIRVGIADNVVHFDWSASFDAGPEAKAAYEDALARIQSGEITIDIGAY